jgi:hypothetical protein
MGLLPGIRRVEGGALGPAGVKGRRGDYDFIRTDGTVIKGDLYEPTQDAVSKIVSQIYSKSGQADVVVVQLGSGSSGAITATGARQIASDVLSTPGHGIRRVIVRSGPRTLADQRTH